MSCTISKRQDAIEKHLAQIDWDYCNPAFGFFLQKNQNFSFFQLLQSNETYIFNDEENIPDLDSNIFSTIVSNCNKYLMGLNFI